MLGKRDFNAVLLDICANFQDVLSAQVTLRFPIFVELSFSIID